MPYTKLNASGKTCYYDHHGRQCSICYRFYSWDYYWVAGNKNAVNAKLSECKLCSSAKDAERRLRYRLEALTILGGKCKWPNCNIDDPEMLQVDHINGNITRESSQKAVANIRAGQTEKYQVLCANHHMKKSYSEGDFTKRYTDKGIPIPDFSFFLPDSQIKLF